VTDERPGARRALEPRRDTWRERLRRPGTVTGVALVLIALQVAFRTWAVSGSWFLVDDYIFLSAIARGDDDLDWYLRIHQGHFMPLSFVLVKLVSFAPAFSWAAVTVEIAVLQLLASLAAWWMLRTVFGNRPAVLGLLAVYLFAPLTLPSIMWWAVAINHLPHQIGVCLALGAHVQYLRTRRLGWLALALAGLVLGLSAYTKTALAFPVLAAVPLLWFTTGQPGRRVAQALRRWWPAWVAYAVLGAGFIVVYLHQSVADNLNGQGGRNVELAYTFVVYTLLPSLTGGPLSWKLFAAGPISYVAPSNAVVVLSTLAVTAVVALAWLTRRHALRALWIPALYVAASVALVIAGRSYVIALMGAREVGLHLQYLSDAAPFVVLGLGGLLLRVPGAVESSTRRATPLLTRSVPRPLVVGVVALALVGAAVSTLRYVEPWRSDFRERVFHENAVRTLESGTPLADEVVPESIMAPVFGDNALVRRYFAPTGAADKVRRAGVDLQLLDETGLPVPAVVDGTPRTTKDPSEPCPYRVHDEPRTIAVGPVVDFPFWVQIDYSTLVGGDVAVVAGKERTGLRLEPGEHRAFVRTQGDFDRVTIWPAERQVLCVSAIRVGFLTAQEGTS
jgi:hypothetical protein